MALNLQNNKPAQTKAVAKKKSATYSDAASAGSPGGPSVNASGTLGPEPQSPWQQVTKGLGTATSAANAAATAYAKANPTAPPTQEAIAPYLTGEQAATFQTAYGADQQGIYGDYNSLSDNISNYQTNAAQNSSNYSGAYDNTNWSLAARGMESSSIADSNIADLTATYVSNAQNFLTNYNSEKTSLLLDASSKATNEADLATDYTGQAVQNAQALAAQNPEATNGGVDTVAPGGFDTSGMANAATAGLATSSMPSAASLNQTYVAPTLATDYANHPVINPTQPQQVGNSVKLATASSTANPALANIARMRAAATTPGAPT